MKAADLARLGLVTVPTLMGKAPGVSATAAGLTVEQAEARDASGFEPRYNVVIGRTDLGLRAGVVDVEGDGPEGVARLRELIGTPPNMTVPPEHSSHGGSAHWLLRLDVPDNHEVRIGSGLLPNVDVPWQFLAIDGDRREWHHTDIVDAPESLRKLLVRPKTQRAAVEAGTWSGDGYGTPAAVAFIEGYCDRLRGAPDGEWNNTLFLAARWAGELVAGGTLDAEFAKESVFNAMDDPFEKAAAETFESGWRAGLAKPRRLSEDTRAPVEEDEEAWEPSRHPLAVQRTGRDDGRDWGRLPAAELVEAFTLGQADMDDIRPPTWLVPGRLQADVLAQLSGPSGVGKSVAALGWALDLTSQPADGGVGEALGFRFKAARVLYLAAEGISGHRARIKAWEAEHRRKWDPDRLRFRDDVPPLLDRDGMRQYVAMLRYSGPWDIVIVDTLSRAIAGANENDQEVMSAAVESMDAVRRAVGGTVLVVHHFGWDGTRQRGSSVLYAACDNVVYLHDRGKGRIQMVTSKIKDGRPADTETLQLAEAGGSVVLRAAGNADTGAPADEEAVLALIDQAPDRFVTAGQVAQATTWSSGKVGSVLKAMFEGDRLVRDKVGKGSYVYSRPSP